MINEDSIARCVQESESDNQKMLDLSFRFMFMRRIDNLESVAHGLMQLDLSANNIRRIEGL